MQTVDHDKSPESDDTKKRTPAQMAAEMSSLSRPIDPAYATNRYILIAAALATIIGGIVAAINGDNIIIRALTVGGATLVGWIIGRELEPDYDWSAFAGAGLAFVAALFVGPFSLLVVSAGIIYPRVVNRTVGPRMKLTDLITVVALTGLIVFLTPYWTLALVAAIALLLDGTLSSPLYPANRASLPAAVIVTSFIPISAIINGLPVAEGSTTLAFSLVAVITGLFTWTIAKTRTVTCKADATDDPLNLWRVQAGMVVGLLVGLFMLWFGTAGIVTAAPVWAAMAGVGLYRLGMGRR